jgi:hypothetical protein
MKRLTHIAAIAVIALGVSSGVALGVEKPYMAPDADKVVVSGQTYTFEQQIKMKAAEMYPERSVKFERLDGRDGRAVYKITIDGNDVKTDGSLGISKAQDESAADGY